MTAPACPRALCTPALPERTWLSSRATCLYHPVAIDSSPSPSTPRTAHPCPLLQPGHESFEKQVETRLGSGWADSLWDPL